MNARGAGALGPLSIRDKATAGLLFLALCAMSVFIVAKYLAEGSGTKSGTDLISEQHRSVPADTYFVTITDRSGHRVVVRLIFLDNKLLDARVVGAE